MRVSQQHQQTTVLKAQELPQSVTEKKSKLTIMNSRWANSYQLSNNSGIQKMGDGLSTCQEKIIDYQQMYTSEVRAQK